MTNIEKLPGAKEPAFLGRDLHLEVLNLLPADSHPMIAVCEFVLHRYFDLTFSTLC